MTTVALGGPLTPEDVVGVARGGFRVAFPEEAERRVARGRAFVDRLADGDVTAALALIEDGSLLEYTGGFLRAIHTPGHARDHMCFIDDARGILFSGDHIVGEGTVFISPEGGGMAAYMASLERLLALDVRAIFPAHGPVIEPGRPKIEEYLAHRRMRERQVLEGLRGGARRVPELVEMIYAEVPRSLHGLAAESTLSHLLKLQAEGAVRSRCGCGCASSDGRLRAPSPRLP